MLDSPADLETLSCSCFSLFSRLPRGSIIIIRSVLVLKVGLTFGKYDKVSHKIVTGDPVTVNVVVSFHRGTTV